MEQPLKDLLRIVGSRNILQQCHIVFSVRLYHGLSRIRIIHVKRSLILVDGLCVCVDAIDVSLRGCVENWQVFGVPESDSYVIPYSVVSIRLSHCQTKDSQGHTYK